MPGLGRRLDARRRVDEVARDHPLAFGREVDRRLAREHAGAQRELRRADLLPERRDRDDEVERRPHRALGVVLLRRRRSPDGHDRVADELLHRAAVDPDQAAAGVEVAGEQLPHLLGVARLRERREADEVGEEDGDEPALGRFRGRGGRGRPMRPRAERTAALAAEAHRRARSQRRNSGT